MDTRERDLVFSGNVNGSNPELEVTLPRSQLKELTCIDIYD